eukprot:TRINITY_DN13247_c0_g1_i1.p1 TRINITY_DN13247_c0_g1~~TRINITY_DN13247_c0_g1_i1.p1  ORF type:complete len:496 (-),score=112.78 TRINITY_DN13247_c0_g1_i1:90-1577(-)
MQCHVRCDGSRSFVRTCKLRLARASTGRRRRTLCRCRSSRSTPSAWWRWRRWTRATRGRCGHGRRRCGGSVTQRSRFSVCCCCVCVATRTRQRGTRARAKEQPRRWRAGTASNSRVGECSAASDNTCTPLQLLVVYSHVVCDGLGVNILTHHLLRFASEQPPLHSVASTSPSPTTTDLIYGVGGHAPWWLRLLSKPLALVVYSALTAHLPTPSLPVTPHVPLNASSAGYSYRFLREPVFDKLRQSAKAHHVSVGSALAAAEMFAIVHLCSKTQHASGGGGWPPPSQRTLSLPLLFSINLRERCAFERYPEHLGNYVNAAMHDFSFARTTPFWALAQRVHANTAKSIAHPFFSSHALALADALMRLPATWERTVSAGPGGVTSTGLYSSNIGRYKYPTEYSLAGGKRLHVRALNLVQNFHPASLYLGLFPSCVGSCLSLTLQYAEEHLGAGSALMEEFLDDVVAVLDRTAHAEGEHASTPITEFKYPSCTRACCSS